MSANATTANSVVVQELESATSVASFESSNVETFRRTLVASLQQVVRMMVIASEENGMTRYSSSFQFEQILYTSIPWKDLLQRHHALRHRLRGRQKGTDTNKTTTTALEEVLKCLLNPCVVPLAMSSSTAFLLLRVLVEDTTTFTEQPVSVKHHVLMRPLQQILAKRPSVLSLGSRIHSYVQSYFSLTTVESVSIQRAHRLVSVCKHVSLERTCHVRILVEILQNVDDADVHLLQTTKSSTPFPKRGVSCLCKTRRRSKMHSDNEEDAAGLRVKTVNVAGGGMVQISRFPKQLKCPACQYRLSCSSRDFTQLSVDLVLLRARLYRKIVSIMEDGARHDHHKHHDVRLLHVVILLACQSPNSASLRLCVVLYTGYVRNGYTKAVQHLWNIFCEGNSSFGAGVLRIYAELIVESFHFDDALKCWTALQPLVQCVLKLCDLQLLSCSDDDKSGRAHHDDSNTRDVLQCLSYILCRRRPVLVAVEEEATWQTLISKLSLAFADASWWISADASSMHEREERLSTLQALGIVGFLDDTTVMMDTSVLLRNKDSLWPFPKHATIRCAYRRMCHNNNNNNSLASKDLLSSQLGSIPGKPPMTSITPVKTRDDRTLGTPMMDYLNDDVFKVIFSFLGYQRLVKASGVCKTWNKLIQRNNSLWGNAYAARFPLLEHETSIVVSITKGESELGSWRSLLVNKVTVERTLRFKRHMSGWKHRTCAHIGCLMVLKSPTQMTRHYGTHAVGKSTRRNTGRLAATKRKSIASTENWLPSAKRVREYVERKAQSAN